MTDFNDANHPPVPRVKGLLQRTVAAGDRVTLDASDSMDPDGDELEFEWLFYPEVGSYRGALPALTNATSPRASFVAPKANAANTIHLIVAVTDKGSPSLTRYRRVIVTVDPNADQDNEETDSAR